MSKGTVVVAGALANKPRNGGNAWTRLHWLLAFRKLGFDPYFLEEIRSAVCVDADGRPAPPAASINAAYLAAVMKQFGFERRFTLLCDGTKPILGQELNRLEDLVGRADILFNISGHLQAPALKLAPRSRIYLDDDPGYTQIWHATGQLGARLSGHAHYFTFGANIGTDACQIPTGDIRWARTRPPIVLDEWPRRADEKFGQFTTVASWRGPFGTVEFGGKTYGPKAHEFRKLLTLPAKTGLKFELALDIHEADGKDRAALAQAGWQVASPEVAATPDAFRSYVQNSSAEFSVAQPLYVHSRSGWFSDRTAAYLASGKPALVQDTGFSQYLPVGEGLLAFRTLEEAVAGAHQIVSRYAHHSRAARALAEEFFDSSKVLGELLNEISTSDVERKSKPA